MTLGRESSNDVTADDPSVSRRHAAIRGDASGFWLEDLRSRNGTFVNGQIVEGEGVHLRDLDAIQLGGTDTAVHCVFRELGGTLIMDRRSL